MKNNSLHHNQGKTLNPVGRKSKKVPYGKKALRIRRKAKNDPTRQPQKITLKRREGKKHRDRKKKLAPKKNTNKSKKATLRRKGRKEANRKRKSGPAKLIKTP